MFIFVACFTTFLDIFGWLNVLHWGGRRSFLGGNTQRAVLAEGFDFLWGEREYLSFLLFSSGLECTITEVNYFKIFMSSVVHLNNSATMISDYKQ